MFNELVSIVMPCYNAEKYITSAIESVIKQTYLYWELIIVDDCSTDTSANIIKEYSQKDSRIKYFKTEKPSGSPALPRNIAIDKAQGRFIAFLDADDIWLPTKLEHQLPLFEHEDIAIVFSDYEKIDEQGNRNNRIIKAPKSVDYKDLLKTDVIGNLTGIYDTVKVGKIYNLNIHHEDYALWLSILKKGFTAMNTGNTEALYRVHSNSVSRNKFKTVCWHWNILRNIENLSLFKSMYCLSFYAIKGLCKYLSIYIYIYQAITCKRNVFNNKSQSANVCPFGKVLYTFPKGLFFFYQLRCC